MEDNAATERGPFNRGERRAFVESGRVERERVACPSLQAGDELLLKFDRLIHRIDMALASELGIACRHRANLCEGHTSFDRLPDGEEGQVACVDQVADFEAGAKPLFQDRDTGREMTAPEVDMVAMKMKECPAQA